ncbi:MAG: hypothetical protein GX771_09780, partial [Halomonadaceae bacterium]|nr:hypothetical protein [Halomonadaceae bacterium]
NGYHEIVETLPASRLIELGGGSPQGLPNTDLRQLPVNQWYMIENMALQPGEKVDRLIYEHGVWDAHTAFAADYAADAIISDEGVVIGDSGDDERSADEEGRWSEDGSHNWEAESEWHDDTAYEAAQGSDWGSEHYPTAHELSAVGGA